MSTDALYLIILRIEERMLQLNQLTLKGYIYI